MTTADDGSVAPFRDASALVERGLQVVERWYSSHVRLLVGEGRPERLAELVQAFDGETDIDLVVGTTAESLSRLAHRLQPNVIVLDLETMPLDQIAEATVELSEMLPASAVMVLEGEETLGIGTSLGANPVLSSIVEFRRAASRPEVAMSIVDVVKRERHMDITEPARVLKRIRRVGHLVAATATPPGDVLVDERLLPDGWKLWDETPAHVWAVSDDVRVTSCSRDFLFGDRPGLATPMLRFALDVYPNEAAARAALTLERVTSSSRFERARVDFPGDSVGSAFLSYGRWVIRIRARADCTTATLWSRGLTPETAAELLGAQMSRLEAGSDRTRLSAADGRAAPQTFPYPSESVDGEVTAPVSDSASNSVLDAARRYLESVPYQFTKTDWGLSLTMTGTNAVFTVNLTANQRWGWLMCYVLGPMKVPANARHTVGEFMHRVNYLMSVGDFEINWDDGAFLYKTTVLAGEGESPTLDTVGAALEIGVNTMDKWYPGVMSILYSGMSAEAAIKRISEPASTGEPSA